MWPWEQQGVQFYSNFDFNILSPHKEEQEEEQQQEEEEPSLNPLLVHLIAAACLIACCLICSLIAAAGCLICSTTVSSSRATCGSPCTCFVWCCPHPLLARLLTAVIPHQLWARKRHQFQRLSQRA